METPRVQSTRNPGKVLTKRHSEALAKQPRASRRHSAVAHPKAAGAPPVEATFMRWFWYLVDSVARLDSLFWECRTARDLGSVRSYSDFVRLLKNPDPGVRMFALEALCRYGCHVGSAQQAQIRREVRNLRGDNTLPNYVYGGSQSDEDELDTVARMAQRALRCLDCDVRPQELSPMSHGVCEPIRSEW